MKVVANQSPKRVMVFWWLVILGFLLTNPVQAWPVDFEGEPPPKEALTLSEALEIALTKHPDLQQAIAQIKSGEFAVIGSTANLYPRFSFSSSAAQTGSTGQPGGLSVVRTGLQRSYGLGISLNQQLLDFGRTRYRVKLSELDLAARRLNYLTVRQTVIGNVVQSYFTLLRQSQAIEIGKANVLNAERLVSQAQGFLEAGTRAKIEVIRAEADLANAEFGLVQAQGGYGRARAALAAAMGEDELTFKMPVDVTLDRPEWTADIVRNLARRSRPDLVATGLRVAQAETRIRSAKSEYYPTVSLNAGYNWNDNVFPPMNTSYNVGLALSVPLINEPALSSAVGQAKADYEDAKASLKSTELRVVREATESYFSYQEALGRADSSFQALRSAEENYRLASERYKVGVGNSLEVSEAQRLLVQARSQELQARYDVQIAVATLLRTTGQLDAEALLPEALRISPVFEIPQDVYPPK